jgi:hypothetical protein
MPRYRETLENVGTLTFWFYWPLVRIWLWIYDGFKKEKKFGVMKADSNGNNRNN